MMFTSNQVLELSGSLDQVQAAIEFAFNYSGYQKSFTRKDSPAKCTYQITDDGRYCLGWSYGSLEKGWNEFPFDFDVGIIALIVKQHLEKQKISYTDYDGSHAKGFLMRAVEDSFSLEEPNIKSPFCGIVEFSPFTCFYAK